MKKSIKIQKSELFITLQEDLSKEVLHLNDLNEEFALCNQRITKYYQNQTKSGTRSQNEQIFSIFQQIDQVEKEYCKALKNSNSLIKQLELQTSNAPIFQKTLKKEIFQHKQTLSRMQFDYTTNKGQFEKLRALSKEWKLFEKQRSTHQRLGKGMKRLEKQNDHIVQMRDIAQQTQKLANNISLDLKSQKSTMLSSIQKLYGVGIAASRAKKLIQKMGRDKLFKKIILSGVIAVFALIIIWLILLKLIKLKNFLF